VQPIDANAYDEPGDYVRFVFEMLYCLSILKTFYDEGCEGYTARVYRRRDKMERFPLEMSEC
jgi:hypothetical protein